MQVNINLTSTFELKIAYHESHSVFCLHSNEQTEYRARWLTRAFDVAKLIVLFRHSKTSFSIMSENVHETAKSGFVDVRFSVWWLILESVRPLTLVEMWTCQLIYSRFQATYSVVYINHIMSTGIIIIFTWSCPEFVYGCRWYTSAPCLQDKLCKHYVHTRLLYQFYVNIVKFYIIMKYVDMREIMSSCQKIMST